MTAGVTLRVLALRRNRENPGTTSPFLASQHRRDSDRPERAPRDSRSWAPAFDAGITLDDAARPSKILPVTRRAEASARKIELAKKIIANAHVALVSALPAPLAPNTVWLDAAEHGADLRALALLQQNYDAHGDADGHMNCDYD